MAKSNNSSSPSPARKTNVQKKMKDSKFPQKKKTDNQKQVPKGKKEKTHKPERKLEQASPRGEVWSKSKKKRMRHKVAVMSKTNDEPLAQDVEVSQKRPRTTESSTPTNRDNGVANGNASSLQKSFMARLTGSRFRELNEDLYTSTSVKAFEKFSSQPDLYDQYHEGFRHQVESWPVNPVNVIVQWLTSTYSSKENDCVVADFGCGDAALAKELLAVERDGKCPFQVHSFDLVACCDLVTACDMSNVPNPTNSIDVAVFCLSLMGTNLADFIREAHRVLKPDGLLKIAEVRSRFESKNKELEDFIDVMKKLGFASTRKDQSNKMFVMLEFKQNGKRPDKNLEYSARPCIYKRR